MTDFPDVFSKRHCSVICDVLQFFVIDLLEWITQPANDDVSKKVTVMHTKNCYDEI
jgi:hypothetical protein